MHGGEGCFTGPLCLTTLFSIACQDGTVVLVNGTASNMGRVEICNNQTYGTICDDFWNELDAAVVCRQLNLTTTGMYQ